MYPKNFVREVLLQLKSIWHFLSGLYLQACGERSRWLPVRGEHHQLDGIRVEFGRIFYTDAATQLEESVALVDDFGEIEISIADGEIARLSSSGRCAAVLVYPDGKTTERLRCNRYSTEILVHAVTQTIARKKIGGSVLVPKSDGQISVDGKCFDLLSADSWSCELKDGSRLEYKSFGQLQHVAGGIQRSFIYAARDRRLLEVDRHRVELRFTFVTSESESPTRILDGLLEVFPEDGSAKCLEHSLYARWDKIDFAAPNGLRVRRDEGSDRLWAYQNQQLIGVAEFAPNAGHNFRAEKSFNRWRFSPGNPVEEPQGNGWFSLATTIALLAVPAAVFGSLFISLDVGYVVGYSIALAVLVAYIVREWRSVLRLVTAS